MTAEFQTGLSTEARSYLAGRGIGSEAVERYRLGQVTAESQLGQAGYTGRIAIPYLTKHGGVVHIKLRRFPDDAPGDKYVSPWPQRLYNTMAMDEADKLGYIGIAFGEFDAQILSWHCGVPSVAVPGDKNWQNHPEWPELFAGYRTVYLFPDNDESCKAVAERVSEDIFDSHMVTLPYKDVTDTFVNKGASIIRERAGLSA